LSGRREDFGQVPPARAVSSAAPPRVVHPRRQPACAAAPPAMRSLAPFGGVATRGSPATSFNRPVACRAAAAALPRQACRVAPLFAPRRPSGAAARAAARRAARSGRGSPAGAPRADIGGEYIENYDDVDRMMLNYFTYKARLKACVSLCASPRVVTFVSLRRGFSLLLTPHCARCCAGGAHDACAAGRDGHVTREAGIQARRSRRCRPRRARCCTVVAPPATAAAC